MTKSEIKAELEFLTDSQVRTSLGLRALLLLLERDPKLRDEINNIREDLNHS